MKKLELTLPLQMFQIVVARSESYFDILNLELNSPSLNRVIVSRHGFVGNTRIELSLIFNFLEK